MPTDPTATAPNGDQDRITDSAAPWRPWCADCVHRETSANQRQAVTIINGTAYCAVHAKNHKPGVVR